MAFLYPRRPPAPPLLVEYLKDEHFLVLHDADDQVEHKEGAPVHDLYAAHDPDADVELEGVDVAAGAGRDSHGEPGRCGKRRAGQSVRETREKCDRNGPTVLCV